MIQLADRLARRKSQLVKSGPDRDLYKTAANRFFWLNKIGHVDISIIETGIFEAASTRIVNQYVKKGHVVLDVGANIGYYTVLLSELVSNEGRVIAFEPTRHFGNVLKANVEANQLTNVDVIDYGLSNRDREVDIDIGISSATIHSSNYYDPIIRHERISLKTLDNFVSENNISRIDFIKIDVDGHEPYFFDGAWAVLEKLDPFILFEVSHLHYMKAGINLCEFYKKLKEKGYRIYYEQDLEEIRELDVFLIKCGNFERSSNILICKKNLDDLQRAAI
jgi:FkbM family methyltransferase